MKLYSLNEKIPCASIAQLQIPKTNSNHVPLYQLHQKKKKIVAVRSLNIFPKFFPK